MNLSDQARAEDLRPQSGNVFVNLRDPDAEQRLTEACAKVVGDDARPTGRLRMLQTRTAGRLQHEWRGMFGSIWLDVPIVQVAEMPPRTDQF